MIGTASAASVIGIALEKISLYVLKSEVVFLALLAFRTGNDGNLPLAIASDKLIRRLNQSITAKAPTLPITPPKEAPATAHACPYPSVKAAYAKATAVITRAIC